MSIQTDKIMLNKEVFRGKDIFSVEDSIIIPDVKPDIISIVDTNTNLYVYKNEINNGKIKIDGGIQLDTIYIADDEKNSIRAIHNNLDFSKIIDTQKENKFNEEKLIISSKLNIKSIDSKIINGRKISIKANVEYEIIIYSKEEMEYIKSVDDDSMQKLSKTISINTLKSYGDTISSAKDTLSLDDNLSDILCYKISVKNKEQKISYNKILSKAECIVNFLYIGEENEIKRASTSIPIMSFIDMPGVSEEELSISDYKIRNINIKQDSTNNNSILIEIEFKIDCRLYEKRDIELIEDLYSVDNEITLYEDPIALEQNRGLYTSMCNIDNKINCSEAKDNKIYITDMKINELNQKVANDTVYYEGDISVDYLFESNISGRLEQRNLSVPLSHSMKVDGITKNTKIDTSCEINNIEYRDAQNGEQNLNMELGFIVDKYDEFKVNLINNIKSERIDQNKRQSSLIIYFVKEGDTLWKIAKKFKTTVEEIAEINNIENVDKLTIGEQLFIPRHVQKCTC